MQVTNTCTTIMSIKAVVVIVIEQIGFPNINVKDALKAVCFGFW
ncbi:MAG: hypothetical protein RMJ87_02100 [Cytophagales bacterium]|nr:hypothetical protein [Cytophagales bacterium]